MGIIKRISHSLILSSLFYFWGCASFWTPAQGQINMSRPQDGLDEYVRMGSESGVIPEPLPKIPPPPAVSLPTPAAIESRSNMSLNWRCRALALANEYPPKKNNLSWTIPLGYKQGQDLLKQAINQIGFNIIAEYDDAGQFLIRPVEAAKNEEVIIVSQPVSEKNTLFKMHSVLHNLADGKKIHCLPDIMKSLFENRGLLQ